MSKSKQVQQLFVEILQDDAQEALALSSGIFVAMYVEYLSRQGHDSTRDIKIKSGDGQRDITIHAIPQE